MAVCVSVCMRVSRDNHALGHGKLGGDLLWYRVNGSDSVRAMPNQYWPVRGISKRCRSPRLTVS